MGANMFWRLVLRALRLRLQRVAIIFAALSVGSAIVTAMSAVYFDINSKMSQELRTFGANFYIGSQHQNLMSQAQFEQIIQQAPQGLLNAAGPYLYGITRSELEKIVIMGVWFDTMPTLAPYWQINGQQIGVNFDQRNVMIGKTLAERLHLNVGDSITLSNDQQQKQPFNIKAIIEAGDATDNMLIVNLEFAQQWLNKANEISYALLSVKNEQGQVEQFAEQLRQQYPELEIRPIRKVSASEGQILDKIKGLMGLISLVILVLATLCVNTTLIAIIAERAKEFALQKALGAKRRDIIKQITTETLLIALFATIVGLVLGYILAQILGIAVFKSSIDLRLPVIPITLLLSLIVTLLAVIVPTRRALQIETANVLKGE
ncbi:ABC transporter permease [Testudinibacter sp. TR-2022]|nr:FtsX-like permease family protein [Testudinibacter sp. TR-2022]TNH08408.1 ABC transporter permease [Pasteurellaceae bacterium Phil11]TNH23618.1 ABC transporter permease [Testudinibacter sp. TR-2022]TNH28095.1 ABC transporter permease [Testudinibacter sp. TR-2022]